MKTRVIFQNQHYEACELNGRLCVTHKRKQGGVYLTEDISGEWIDAIKTATDKQEAHALCRALLNQ